MTTPIPGQNREGPDRWAARAPDNRRKASTNIASNLGSNWARNSRASALRQQAPSNTYQLDNPRTLDRRFRQEKTSDDTGEDEGIAVNKNNVQDYSDGGIRKNSVANHETEAMTQRARAQCTEDSPEFTVPEAMVAVQKLQRLKELQRRRDLTERYYSQEIRRLIGEQYLGPGNTAALPPFRNNERLQNSNVQAYSGDRFRNALKSLEPCGTMTTITRLDCGCIQETTRPIFTTSRGRVLKKACNHLENEVLLEVAPPNTQEHLHASLDTRKPRCNSAKPRKRCPLTGGNYREINVDFADDFGIVNQQRNLTRKPTISQERRSSRGIIPIRRYSDTSIANCT